ncbi:MAG: DUF2971 domain-containing protein [Anaerolineales bacterium]|nr:DUF2971 domain-containing protein [Anaerolineales bacterium]
MIAQKVDAVPMTENNSIINELFGIMPPDSLFHYTSSAGLAGIMESGKIWTSKITYLNDNSELQLAVDYIKNEIELQEKGIGTTRTKEELELMSRSLAYIETVNVSVASFTEMGNQLSQWRGYCQIGNGYSLSFNGAKLRQKVHEKDGFHLLPCIYTEKDHKRLAKELVDHYPTQELRELKKSFSDAVLFYAPLIKSESFKEEKEWRLITPPLSYLDASFRQGAHSLIPYWEFEIDLENTIEKIIVGPTPEPKLASLAVHGLAIKKGLVRLLKDSCITHSEIPFRKI